MAISLRCANTTCQKPLRVKDEAAGKRVKCPACGQMIVVPALDTHSSPESAAPKLPVATGKPTPTPRQGPAAGPGPSAPANRQPQTSPAALPVSDHRPSDSSPERPARAQPEKEADAALAEMRDALTHFRESSDSLSFKLGMVLVLTTLAGILLWIYVGWLLGIAVAVGAYVLLLLIQIPLRRPIEQRAVDEVAALEAKHGLSRKASLEMVCADNLAKGDGTFNGFVSTVWKLAINPGAFATAIETGDHQKLEALLERTPELATWSSTWRFGTHKDAALGFAASLTKAEVVRVLLRHGVNANAHGELGLAAVHWAAAKDSAEAVGILLDAGGDVNALDRFGMTALHWAAVIGSLPMVELLLGRGADARAVDRFGATTIHCLLESGISNISDPNDPQYSRWSAGAPGILKLLLARGADANARSEYHASPLAIAQRQELKQLEELLRRQGAQQAAGTEQTPGSYQEQFTLIHNARKQSTEARLRMDQIVTQVVVVIGEHREAIDRKAREASSESAQGRTDNAPEQAKPPSTGPRAPPLPAYTGTKQCTVCGRQVHVLAHVCPACGEQGVLLSSIPPEELQEILNRQAEARAIVDQSVGLMQAGKYKEAEVILTRAQKINPYNANAFGNLGGVYFLQGQYAEAVPWLEKALALDPTLENIPERLADARQKAG